MFHGDAFFIYSCFYKKVTYFVFLNNHLINPVNVRLVTNGLMNQVTYQKLF
ncbi:hypothetical protein VCHA29O37_100018 [Vibrio chagasii]|nr:hypothetical protein VCHA29O37_100018 [Vibrio chagasii]